MIYIYLILAIINLILFEWHRRHYKNEKRKFRISWCYFTFGFSIGPYLWTIFDLIYGNPTDIRTLWCTLIFMVTTIIMILINYKTRINEFALLII